MLAYLFWHCLRDGESREHYEQALVAFHRRLRTVPVRGLAASGTARIAAGLPWMTGEGYEDWYAVEDYAALGMLNRTATDAAHLDAHDLVAHAASFGTGGLYALERGRLRANNDRCIWVSKPDGVSYPDLRELLQRHAGSDDISVWRRQLVLGPAPEFRLSANSLPSLPASLTPITCPLANLDTA